MVYDVVWYHVLVRTYWIRVTYHFSSREYHPLFQDVTTTKQGFYSSSPGKGVKYVYYLVGVFFGGRKPVSARAWVGGLAWFDESRRVCTTVLILLQREG